MYRRLASMAAGRFHTAIGYYNDAYHHGYYFVLPTERPTAVRVEDAVGSLLNIPSAYTLMVTFVLNTNACSAMTPISPTGEVLQGR